MAVKQVATQEGINPQIIPMIDIMFLLLLFFMVGADMGQRELEDVRLPLLAMAMPIDKAPDAVRSLTINCYHVPEAECREYAGDGICAEDTHWRIGIRGRDVAVEDLASVLEPFAAAHRKMLDPDVPLLSELPVQIRADRSILYGRVQAITSACGAVGIYRAEIGAGIPAAEVAAR